MRPKVTAAMCGLSVVTVVVAVHAGSRPGPTSVRGAAPTGIVGPTASPATTAATRTPVRTPVVPTTRVNGAAIDTQYGPVQVQLTVRGHRIVRAEAIEYPQGSRHDQEINSYAIPQLDSETVRAQSASIDAVSGATYTSEGYLGSLQSALDAAHRAGVL